MPMTPEQWQQVSPKERHRRAAHNGGARWRTCPECGERRGTTAYRREAAVCSRCEDAMAQSLGYQDYGDYLARHVVRCRVCGEDWHMSAYTDTRQDVCWLCHSTGKRPRAKRRTTLARTLAKADAIEQGTAAR